MIEICKISATVAKLNECGLIFSCSGLVMPPTLKKLMGHIAFGACVGAWVGACVGASHFLYLL